ncbi:MAG: DNA-directed RNA polymerase subunit beta' [Candidatus Sumerlaeales bacterium]|nr:DNA-directed RNA polymerase subunit beta' [Candidatus Sumerlaeales bacterium]
MKDNKNSSKKAKRIKKNNEVEVSPFNYDRDELPTSGGYLDDMLTNPTDKIDLTNYRVIPLCIERQEKGNAQNNDLNKLNVVARISLASPAQIYSWGQHRNKNLTIGVGINSHNNQDDEIGEVKKPDTINYRTFKPEKDGLFCEKIFGPTKDWECSCGKYKKQKYKGVICERCGVEVIESKVRRHRMGYIKLAAPICHIWFYRGASSRIAHLLDVPYKELAKLVNFQTNIVVSVPKDLQKVLPAQKTFLTDEEVYELRKTTGRVEFKSIDEQTWFDRLTFIDSSSESDIYEHDEEDDSTTHMDDRWTVTIMSGAAAVRCLLIMLELGADTIEEAIEILQSAKNVARTQGVNAIGGLMTESKIPETIDEAIALLLNKTTGNPPGIDQLNAKLVEDMRKEKSSMRTAKITKRLKTVNSFCGSGNLPHWMVLEVLPVIPPELRPLINLDGGRFATSDLNDLYCRVIHRNNRLKKLMELRGPDVISRNEKRMLQDAVDALFDNARTARASKNRTNNHQLKSLSDMLKGKQGRFRQNLLGKRVDYSGRSVIVVGPELQFNQCGLPKKMALELFEPFVIRELKRRGHAITPKSAKKKIEAEEPIVYEILEDVIKGHPVLLNRAPTLHRLGIQAFFPKLVEGKAIQLHPMSCAAFNADFDGDQMAVHVPLSTEAKLEAINLMLAQNNILSLAHGGVIASPSQDMVLGLYYLNKWHIPCNIERYNSLLSETDDQLKKIDKLREKMLEMMSQFCDRRYVLNRDFDFRKWRHEVLNSSNKDMIALLQLIPVFSSAELCLQALQQGAVKLQELVFVGIGVYDPETKEVKTRIMPTTPGRLEFREILPVQLRSDIDFISFEESTIKGTLAQIAEKTYKTVDKKTAATVLDKMKALGYKHAKTGGLSIGLSDMKIPEGKSAILDVAIMNAAVARDRFSKGVITEEERYRRIVHEWSRATDLLTDEVKNTMKNDRHGLNSVWMMANSGARGNMAQVRQLTGMRGLMQKPIKKITGGMGEVIESPITSNFREGLSVLEYFISTHGARKGLADTALKTSEAGYLTRRLVDVSQDVFITENDCGTTDYIEVEAIKEQTQTGYRELVPLKDRLRGRVVAEDIRDPNDHSILISKNEMISDVVADKIDKIGIKKVKIRSVLTCKTHRGVCASCYGRNMSTGEMVELGEAVGVISAQSIGEPGTQLTLRTFHIGGAANITAEGWYQADKNGKVKYVDIEFLEMADGTLKVTNRTGHLEVEAKNGTKQELPQLNYGATLRVKDGQDVKDKQILAQWDPHTLPIMCEMEGFVYFGDIMNETIAVERMPEGAIKREVVETSLRPSLIVVNPAESGNPEDAQIKTFALSAGTVLSQLFTKMPEEKDKRDEKMEDYLKEKFGFERVRQVFSAVEGKRKGIPMLAHPGDVLATISHVSGVKSKDITGGLPRVEELFEARKPKDAAILAEEDGVFHLRGNTRTTRRAVIETTDGKTIDLVIPGNRHLMITDGSKVTKGMVLTDGMESPHDILRIKGRKALMEFLVTEVQLVYRMQSVKLNDKHIECIVRQMLKKREVTKPGDTKFIVKQSVDESEFEAENKRVTESGGQPAEGTPKLLGITKAALETDSFISAAAFQETTKVLAESAVRGRIDFLNGLKENIIMGMLIPAGTGLPQYRRLVVADPNEPVKGMYELEGEEEPQELPATKPFEDETPDETEVEDESTYVFDADTEENSGFSIIDDSEN